MFLHDNHHQKDANGTAKEKRNFIKAIIKILYKNKSVNTL